MTVVLKTSRFWVLKQLIIRNHYSTSRLLSLEKGTTNWCAFLWGCYWNKLHNRTFLKKNVKNVFEFAEKNRVFRFMLEAFFVNIRTLSCFKDDRTSIILGKKRYVVVLFVFLREFIGVRPLWGAPCQSCLSFVKEPCQ